MERLLRQTNIASLALAAALFYLVVQFFVGEQSVLAWVNHAQQEGALRAEAARLSAERAALAAQAARLDPDRADPDAVESRAYDLLGFAGPDDLVVALPPAQGAPAVTR